MPWTVTSLAYLADQLWNPSRIPNIVDETRAELVDCEFWMKAKESSGASRRAILAEAEVYFSLSRISLRDSRIRRIALKIEKSHTLSNTTIWGTAVNLAVLISVLQKS